MISTPIPHASTPTLRPERAATNEYAQKRVYYMTNIVLNGVVIGEVAMVGREDPLCPYDGEHGYLLYGFFPLGAKRPTICVCQEHVHTDRIFGGIIDKIKEFPNAKRT